MPWPPPLRFVLLQQLRPGLCGPRLRWHRLRSPDLQHQLQHWLLLQRLWPSRSSWPSRLRQQLPLTPWNQVFQRSFQVEFRWSRHDALPWQTGMSAAPVISSMDGPLNLATRQVESCRHFQATATSRAVACFVFVASRSA